MSTLQRAIEIATEAHKGQYDKAGNDYIGHPLRVMEMGKTEDEILQAAKEIVNVPADLVEWRVDWFESIFDIEKVKLLLGELRKVLGDIPLLFTFRTKAEGGEKEITYERPL
mgnify:CR=1 FL=1